MSPATLLEEGRTAGSNENRKAVECSRRSVDNHEHAPDAAADIADANANDASAAILEVLSPPLAFEDAAGAPEDMTAGDKALSGGVSSVGDPHGENLRASETIVAVPPRRCPASRKEQPMAAEETVAALTDGSGAGVSGRKPERQDVGTSPSQVDKQNGEEEEDVEEETEDVPQNSVIVRRSGNVGAPGARRDGSSLSVSELGLNSRQRDPPIEAPNTERSSGGGERNSPDGVSLYFPLEESRAEREKAATVFTGKRAEEEVRGVLQTASNRRRDAATIAPLRSSSPLNDAPVGGRSVGGGGVGSAAGEPGPAVTDMSASLTANDREHTVESKNISDIPVVAATAKIPAELGAAAPDEGAPPTVNDGIHRRDYENTSDVLKVAAAAKTAAVELTCLTDERPRAKLVSAREVLASGGATTRRYGIEVKGVREDDSDKEPVFTEGAAGRGRTNWAAAVYGREESLTYSGEEDNTLDGSGVAEIVAIGPTASAGQGPDAVAVAPGPASTSGSVRVKERENVGAEVEEGGANPATRSPAHTAATFEVNPSLEARGCGETGRARSVVRPRAEIETKKREPRQMVGRAQQVVFTSEEESPSSVSEGWTVLQRLRSSPVPSFPWESPPENARRLSSEPNGAASSGGTAPAPSALLPEVKAGATAEAKTESDRMTRVMKESKLLSEEKAVEAKSVIESAGAGESCPRPIALAAAAAVVTTGATAVAAKSIKAVGDSSSRGGVERVLVSGASEVDQSAVDRAKAREKPGAGVIKPLYFNTATARLVGEMALVSSEGRSFSSGRHEDVDCASSPERPRQATALEAEGRSPDTDIDTEIDSDGSPGLRRPSSGGESGTTAAATTTYASSVAGEDVCRTDLSVSSSAAATAAAAVTVPLVRCQGSNANVAAASVGEGRRQRETGDSSTLEDWEERNKNVGSAVNSSGQAGRKRSRGSSAGDEDVPGGAREKMFVRAVSAKSGSKSAVEKALKDLGKGRG